MYSNFQQRFPHSLRKFSVSPFVFLALFFVGNTNSIFKSILLVLAIALFGRTYAERCFDRNFSLILLFFFLYFIVSALDSNGKTEFINALFVLPAALYAGGKWMGYRTVDSRQLSISMFLLGMLIASTPILAVISHVLEYGFAGGTRSIAISGDQEMSATVLAGMLVMPVSYGGVIFVTSRALSKLSKVVILALFISALFVAARLGSRTFLLIGGASLLVGILINIRYFGLFKFFLVIAFLSATVYWLFDRILGSIDLFSYFHDRAESDEYGIGTAGGRLEKWNGSLELLISNPSGWDISINGYAHNLWLDAARNGGWIAFLFLITLTLLFLKAFVKSWKRNTGDPLFKTTVACISTGMFLLFSVEPILDGFVYVFGIYCCYWGLLCSYRASATP